MKRSPFALTLLVAAATEFVLLAAPAFAQSEAGPPASEPQPASSNGIGIAPIAGLDDPRTAREIANAIAQRLQSEYGRAAARIDRGDELPRATPDSALVRTWARDGGFERVVVGSVLDGDPPELALEVRDGHSGAPIEAFRVPGSADRTWGEAVARAAARLAGGAPAPASAEDDAGKRPLLGDLRNNDEPIAIEADEIEVAVVEGRRHLQFRRNVKVVQGDITLTTANLDAYYPAKASQPERLVATGDVHVIQGARQATCDRATYLRSTQQVICKGHARLWEGCDVVRGREIQFDLEREHFRVNGAASVVLQNPSPNADGCPGEAAS